jgi:hypothetical protein
MVQTPIFLLLSQSFKKYLKLREVCFWEDFKRDNMRQELRLYIKKTKMHSTRDNDASKGIKSNK